MAKPIPVAALRAGLAGCALAAAALAGWQQLSAQGLGSFNSNAPVDFDAAKIELQDKANRVVLSGDVVIKQGDLTLRAARTTVAYTNTGSLQIQRLDAVGNVLVTRGNEAARGSAAVYDFNKRVIVMSGAAVGQKLVVNYTLDQYGLVSDVWILRKEEIARTWPKTAAEAARWSFDPVAQIWTKP